MEIIPVGVLTEKFRKMSEDLATKIIKEYDLIHATFTICEKGVDVYSSICIMCEHLRKPLPSPTISLSTFGVFSVQDDDGKLYHLLYTCEEVSKGVNDLEAYFSKAVYNLPFDKHPPQGMVV